MIQGTQTEFFAARPGAETSRFGSKAFVQSRNSIQGVVTMNPLKTNNRFWFMFVFILLVSCLDIASAANPQITGSYQVVQKTDLGSQVKVLVRLELTSHGQASVSVVGFLISDFAHPAVGGRQTPAITLRPGASTELTQELVIPRTEFEQWQRGVRPRVLLKLQSSTGTTFTQVIRLSHVATGKGE